MQLSQRASQGSSERPELFGSTERLTVGGLVRAGVAELSLNPRPAHWLSYFYSFTKANQLNLSAAFISVRLRNESWPFL